MDAYRVVLFNGFDRWRHHVRKIGIDDVDAVLRRTRPHATCGRDSGVDDVWLARLRIDPAELHRGELSMRRGVDSLWHCLGETTEQHINDTLDCNRANTDRRRLVRIDDRSGWQR